LEKNFNFLAEKFESLAKEKKFDKQKISENEFVFNHQEKKIKLKLDNNIVRIFDDSDKILCEWFLDENSSKKDLEVAAFDFYETIFGKTQPEIKAIKKSKDLNNTDFFYLIEEMTKIFPEIKLEYEKELNNTKKFRKIKFTREVIMPKISETLEHEKEKSKISKIFKNLCNSYVFGDEDTKCIITMAIFNEIKTPKKQNLSIKFLPNTMKKVWNASLLHKSMK
jgi:ATP-dependent protease Clp ATPase subunit